MPTGGKMPVPALRYVPALQRHELAAEAVVGCEFAGQATHAPAADAPVAAEYLPAPQA